MTQTKIFTLTPGIDAWERQPGETTRKYGQFVTFRDLGITRTLTKTAEKLTLSYGHVRNLAMEYRWQDRVAAWDAHQTDQYLALIEEERRRAAEADAKILRAMTGMVGQALPHMSQRIDKLTVSEFVRLVDTTMRLKRQLFGDTTETIAITGAGVDPLSMHLADFAALPPEERRARIAEMAAAVTRRVTAIDGSDEEEHYPTWDAPADTADAAEGEG